MRSPEKICAALTCRDFESVQSPILDLLEQRNKMKAPPKQRAEREGISGDAVVPALHLQPGLKKISIPLYAALIVVGKHDTVRAIAYPVHELQRPEIKSALRQMVLDQYKSPADAASFRKQPGNSLLVRRVVQHVDKHAHVERSRGMRNGRPVEGVAFNQTSGPWSEFNSANA